MRVSDLGEEKGESVEKAPGWPSFRRQARREEGRKTNTDASWPGRQVPGTQQVAVRKISVWGKLETSKSSLDLEEER